MARHSSLRAADTDREAVAERLRQAAGEGRLEPHELEERLHAALRARTYGDLQRLVSDLPAAAARRARPVALTAFGIAVRVAFVLAMVVAVLTVIAVVAAWWMVWALIWLAVVAKRGCFACGPRRVRPHHAARLH